ncbi:hypothetical protein T01_16178 [Trichinella spiralis]|uniref:Uncharacterized protein n=1 Tax=Trichinella spiralis TaxID=6334 RepID=A0A0V1BJ08_TRISP|nr:hypothetical protein T01_16178 [Trichinella spiralis]
MEKKEDKWRKPRSVSERFWIGWIESFAGPNRIVAFIGQLRHNTQT